MHGLAVSLHVFNPEKSYYKYAPLSETGVRPRRPTKAGDMHFTNSHYMTNLHSNTVLLQRSLLIMKQANNNKMNQRELG